MIKNKSHFKIVTTLLKCFAQYKYFKVLEELLAREDYLDFLNSQASHQDQQRITSTIYYLLINNLVNVERFVGQSSQFQNHLLSVLEEGGLKPKIQVLTIIMKIKKI